jgi:altronate hydrolase
MKDLYRIRAEDTVAVALRPLAKGESPRSGDLVLTALDDVPAGHKIALADIPAGEGIVKYGCVIGRAKTAIPRGGHVHTGNMETALGEKIEYHYAPQPSTGKPSPSAGPVFIQAYRRPDGQIGIRNEIWIIPTVGCVNKPAEILARWAGAEFADNGIDGVFAWTHPYGCSQMGEDHEATRRILAALARHPNAGAVLVLGLGCENNTMESFRRLLDDLDPGRIAFLVCQKCEDEIAEGKKLLARLARAASQFRREQVEASRLVVGMKCGGSDGFSGITANALAGFVSDAVSAFGGTAILTEVPEMFGAEQMLMDRCVSREVFDKTVSLINDFKDYYTAHGQVVYENPSPGNKEGGISTLEDKSCGCVQKGGGAPVKDVIRYGERVPPGGGGGIVLLEGPGNDMVSVTAMTAAGAHLILFTTGRGTPLGAPVPTIKIASNSELAKNKANWIDFDAGRMLSEDMDSIHNEMLGLLWDTASGTVKTKNELNGCREIAIFKNGVTL